jgi:cyclase
MRRQRVIPVLLLAEQGLVKTRRFRQPRYLGDPINAVRIFNDKQVDELILLDIEATAKQRIDFDWIEDIVSEAFMPVAYGGGIGALDQCERLFARGVEKIVVNTAAVERPTLIGEIAARFGSQAIVVAIDAKRGFWGKYRSYIRGGRRDSGRDPATLARQVEAAGAGEILITSIDREGAFTGYDLDLLRNVAQAVRIPVIAHGGAGTVDHFCQAIAEAGCSAVAAGSMFVFASKDEGVLINYPSAVELEQQLWTRAN